MAVRARERGSLAVVAAVVTAVLAFGSASAADAEAGRRKAQACVDCHGAIGISLFPHTPNLADQKEMYLLKQLMDFRFGGRASGGIHEGERQQLLMGHRTEGFDVGDLEDLAAWYASLPCADSGARGPATPPAKADRCEPCHGSEGRSRKALVPSLAGQKEAYIRQQFALFREGAFQGAPAGPSRTRRHPLMSLPAAEANEAEARALAAWFAGRRCR